MTKAAKIPYENYGLPPSAELGGKFVDFNKVRKVIKRVKIKRRKNGTNRKHRMDRRR